MTKQPDVVVFQRAFVDALDGDIMAALMLSQIYYWYTPTLEGKPKLQVIKFGKWWLAKSHVDWTRELGMTAKQSRRALQVLVDKGLVVTEVMKFGGSPVNHCRLVFADGKRVLNGPLGDFHLSLKENPFAPEGKTLTETTTQTTTSIKEAIENPIAITNPDQAQELTGKEKKTNPELLKNVSEDVKGNLMNLEEAMAKVRKKQEQNLLKATPTTLGLLWKKKLAEQTGEYVKALTQKELGQFKHLIAAVGQDSMSVVNWALGEWSLFAWEVKAAKGLSTAPDKPTIGFLIQHHDVAVNLMKPAAVKPAPVTAPVPIDKPSTLPQPEEAAPLASEADVLATLEKLQQLSGH